MFISGVNDTGDKMFGRRCQWHRWLDSPAYVSLPTPENVKYAKIPSLGVKYTQLRSSQKMEKFFIFYRRCCWQRWQTFIRDYLHELKKKNETITVAYSGARGTLIYEKNQMYREGFLLLPFNN